MAGKSSKKSSMVEYRPVPENGESMGNKSDAESIELNDEEKLVLYCLGALDNTPLRSKIKIQKLLFLVSNVFKGFDELFRFEPHLFGPYSEIAVNVLNSLIGLGYVEKRRSNYRLSDEGMRVFRSLRPKRELVDVIEDFKKFLNDLTDDEILAFVYTSYPQYIGESVKWDELKKNRVNLAVSLLKKEKVSFSKASEISGMNPVEFDDILKMRGIRWRK